MRLATVVGVLGVVAIGMAQAPAAEEAGFVAGTTPDRRPEGAPEITRYEKDTAWFAHALRGVAEPHPESLTWLDDQGAWYTPFTRSGMLGVYDIRGLHEP
jgi:hypothetical protein